LRHPPVPPGVAPCPVRVARRPRVHDVAAAGPARALDVGVAAPQQGPVLAEWVAGGVTRWKFLKVVWLVVWNMNGLWLSHIDWECHHPNWRTPSFFRRVGIPPTRSLWMMRPCGNYKK
jgi:hypothetical protein